MNGVPVLSAPLTLDTLNAMDRGAFVNALGETFEHAPWVAESAWLEQPFASAEALHAAMIGVVRRSPQTTQIAFLCGHPELAGREAQAGSMTNDSQHEQASAGLGSMTQEEMARMAHLNGIYRGRHGIPFIIAALRHTKAQIFDEMQRRIDRDTADEFVEAMTQIDHITRLRVRALLSAS